MKRCFNFYNALYVVIFSLAFHAASRALPPNEGFKLVDGICASIEGEPPVLKSEIKRSMAKNQQSFEQARQALIGDRLLWVLAKKQMKYNVQETIKASKDHLKQVMNNNDLSHQEFASTLMRPPYSTTVPQFEREIATDILRNNVLANLSNQVAIADEEVLAYAEENRVQRIVFISVIPRRGAKAEQLDGQFSKANEIISAIKPSSTLNDIKLRFAEDENVSIIGPIPYAQEAFKKNYQQRLEAEPGRAVIGPFKDDGEDEGSVTLIWRAPSDYGTDHLEKVRKMLYEQAVAGKLNNATNALKSDSMVIIKNCESP